MADTNDAAAETLRITQERAEELFPSGNIDGADSERFGMTIELSGTVYTGEGSTAESVEKERLAVCHVIASVLKDHLELHLTGETCCNPRFTSHSTRVSDECISDKARITVSARLECQCCTHEIPAHRHYLPFYKCAGCDKISLFRPHGAYTCVLGGTHPMKLIDNSPITFVLL